MSVNHDTFQRKPRRMPAASEIQNQSQLSMRPRASAVPAPPARKGTLNESTSSTRGDCVMPPPGRPWKTLSDRKRVIPGAITRMAAPEMMWSTPKLTVAIACSRPPTAPPAAPMSMPHHGPNSRAP